MKKIAICLATVFFFSTLAIAGPLLEPKWEEIPIVDIPETPSVASPTEIANNQTQEASLEDSLNNRWSKQLTDAVSNQSIINTLQTQSVTK